MGHSRVGDHILAGAHPSPIQQFAGGADNQIKASLRLHHEHLKILKTVL